MAEPAPLFGFEQDGPLFGRCVGFLWIAL